MDAALYVAERLRQLRHNAPHGSSTFYESLTRIASRIEASKDRSRLVEQAALLESIASWEIARPIESELRSLVQKLRDAG